MNTFNITKIIIKEGKIKLKNSLFAILKLDKMLVKKPFFVINLLVKKGIYMFTREYTQAKSLIHAISAARYLHRLEIEMIMKEDIQKINLTNAISLIIAQLSITVNISLESIFSVNTNLQILKMN